MEFGSYAKSIDVIKGLMVITGSPAQLKILEQAIICIRNAWDEEIEAYEEHEDCRRAGQAEESQDEDLVY